MSPRGPLGASERGPGGRSALSTPFPLVPYPGSFHLHPCLCRLTTDSTIKNANTTTNNNSGYSWSAGSALSAVLSVPHSFVLHHIYLRLVQFSTYFTNEETEARRGSRSWVVGMEFEPTGFASRIHALHHSASWAGHHGGYLWIL